MTTSFWLAAAAYLVPTFPLGYFWHLKTFRAEYERLGVYPRLFDTARDAWLQGALQFGAFFGILAWSLAVLPVAAKYRMSSVAAFIKLETGFTVVHYAIVSPLIALASRAAT